MSLQTPSTVSADGISVPDEVAYRVCVTPAGWCFQALTTETVLNAALRAGVELPSSCRNGTCRTCLCKLESGEVAYLIEWPGVSADEKREAYFLPCVAYARADLVIVQPDAARISLPDVLVFPSPSIESD